jgi:rhodanese-related sulfurtransferase
MRWKQFLTPAKNMDRDELKAYMSRNQEGSYTLLDVRQPSEYEKERIPGSLLIPLPELADRAGEIDSTKPVIVY